MSLPSTRETGLASVRAAAARIAASYGLEVFDVQFRREAPGWVLRVVLDRPPGGPPPAAPGEAAPQEEPVGIDDCQRVSQDLSALLDVDPDLADALDRQYTLEVSSPGLDRPLRGEADYRRFAGRLAKIVTTEPVDGQSHFAGRLSGIDEAGDPAGTGPVVLVAEGRRMHRVPLSVIRRARLDVEF